MSRGLLDDTTLQQYAGGLKMAGVQIEEISRMVSLATKTSLVTGEDLTAMMEKIKVAAIEGSQGEFEKLGLTINVNEELKKRMETEGRLVSEMTKNEQVTMRMNILTEKLATTMAAAGIHTEDLSTNLRSMKTDLENLQSAAEQALAGFLTGTELVEIRSTIKGATDSIRKAHGELTLNLLETNRSAAIHLANAAGITEEDLKASLNKIDAFAAGFQGSQDLIVNAVVKASIATKKIPERRDPG